ncbi:MAG: hypothetical protein ACYC3I_04635 [Gemmataceae bacterium]
MPNYPAPSPPTPLPRSGGEGGFWDRLLTAGWRRDHILFELLAVLDGKRLLRIADVTADAPFEYANASNNPSASRE